MLIKLNEIARRLSGSPSGRWINVRGPGHGAGDRSLGVFFDPKADDGFFVHLSPATTPANAEHT